MSNAAFDSVLFLLMLVSEIERIEEYGYAPDLTQIWEAALPHAPEAQRYYETRYRVLLG